MKCWEIKWKISQNIEKNPVKNQKIKKTVVCQKNFGCHKNSGNQKFEERKIAKSINWKKKFWVTAKNSKSRKKSQENGKNYTVCEKKFRQRKNRGKTLTKILPHKFKKRFKFLIFSFKKKLCISEPPPPSFTEKAK